jgi:hypothetical protein
MTRRVAIVTPVLDDWESFAQLVTEISSRFDKEGISFHVVAIDDGSSRACELDRLPLPHDSCIREVQVIELAVNLGHQRAIAVGLSEVANRDDLDAVFIMDSDGEDRPADMASLLAASQRHPQHIILARRTKRSETRVFKAGYHLYKLIFRLLTGRRISFGNFSLLPLGVVRRLVRMPELWNNLPASIMRSRLACTEIPIERGRRYTGSSRMNVVSLAVHGLSAMSVYIDTIFVRVLLFAGFVAGLTLVGIVCAVLVRFTTDLAIPGWTTTAVGTLFIILMQTVVRVVATTLMLLAGRSSRPILPAVDSPSFVRSRKQRLVEPARAEAVAAE